MLFLFRRIECGYRYRQLNIAGKNEENIQNICHKTNRMFRIVQRQTSNITTIINIYKYTIIYMYIIVRMTCTHMSWVCVCVCGLFSDSFNCILVRRVFRILYVKHYGSVCMPRLVGFFPSCRVVFIMSPHPTPFDELFIFSPNNINGISRSYWDNHSRNIIYQQ